MVSKDDTQLDIDIEVFQNPPLNSKQPLFIAGECLRDTLILCGVDREQADMAHRAFVSLRENTQDDVKNRMIKITSQLASSENDLDRNY